MQAPPRPRSTLVSVVLLWVAFYASFTLFTPPLLDDADSVHAEVAREMLLRHDPVTLYANGVRYLEKAPLLYWSMAACMRLFQWFRVGAAPALAVAARIPLALSVLVLVLLAEAMARRLFRSAQAGLYTALILLSSFGLFIFTRITIPDAMVCLWIVASLFCFWRTEELGAQPEEQASHLRRWCFLFAAGCAFNVLTKGLIGLVFPLGIVVIYLALSRGFAGMLRRLRQLHPAGSLAVFLVLAAPWHIAAGLANPGVGHPTPFRWVGGHWLVPLPADGNVRGWFWFYFMNEHLLRYLNLRVPRDYDTDPLWLFWGLCLIWLMPWSAFLFKAAGRAVPWRSPAWRKSFLSHTLTLGQRGLLLLVIWAALPLVFFSLSTRQEYYVLPALPAAALLLGAWLARVEPSNPARYHTAAMRCLVVLAALGALFAAGALYILVHVRTPAGHADLASLLSQNPWDYAWSMGHFLDLNAEALGLFRLPLALAAVALLLGPVTALVLLRRSRTSAAMIALAAGAFLFLVAADLGLRTFSPVLTSAQLAQAILPQVGPDDIVVIHGEYESGSTLGFYLQRPTAYRAVSQGVEFHAWGPHLQAIHPIQIFEGRSSNLWYGSFFPDSPHIFLKPAALAAEWRGSRRVFLWQSLTDPPNQLPPGLSPVFVLARSGGKEILSNQPNR